MQNYPSVEQLAEMVRLLTEARIENWHPLDSIYRRYHGCMYQQSPCWTGTG